MREIKFRAWDTKDKMMYEEVVGIDFYNGVLDMHPDYLCKVSMRDCVLMQFTGRYDKNGKEIYEGDYLSYNIAGNRREVAIVIQDKFGWTFELLNDGFYGDIETPIIRDKWKHIDHCEVIGNIYENPELAKGESCEPISG